MDYLKHISILLILQLFHFYLLPDSFAQVTQEWVASYNGVGVGSNSPQKSAVDKFGNIIIAGKSSDSQYDDFIILKYNSSGNLLWNRRYNGIGNRDDIMTDMILDDSGNIYLTGVSWEGELNGKYNWVSMKYDQNGDTIWRRSLDWIAHELDEPHGMTLDKNNNVFITGFCRTSSFEFERAMVTIKYNSKGDLMWIKSYLPLTFRTNWGYSVTTDDSNNVYSSGYGAIIGGNEIVTIKYNTNGDEIWIRKYPTLYGDYLRPVLSSTDKSNNIIVNGMYYSFGDQYAFNTIKYNSSGDMLWNRIYKGDGNLNFCFALCTDSSENVYAAGRTTSTGTGNDFVTIKYNQFGDTSWIRIFDGGFEQGDEVHDMVVDNLQNVYVTGDTDSLDGTANYLTIKYNSSGIINWIKKYGNGGQYDIPFCINVDNKNSIIVSGFSTLNSTNSAIRTIKYSQITKIVTSNLKEIYNYQFISYPNPFNPRTTISYQLSVKGFIRIKVYNIFGNDIATLVNEKKNSGSFSTEFEGTNLPSGIYFYSLFIDNSFIETKKMLLIR